MPTPRPSIPDPPTKDELSRFDFGQQLVVKWYLDEGLTFQEIGSRMMLTRQRVHQMFWYVIDKVRRQRRAK